MRRFSSSNDFRFVDSEFILAIGIALNFAFRVVREKIFNLQQFKHYPVESNWAMWILAIEQIAPQHLLTDW